MNLSHRKNLDGKWSFHRSAERGLVARLTWRQGCAWADPDVTFQIGRWSLIRISTPIQYVDVEWPPEPVTPITDTVDIRHIGCPH